MAKAGKVKKADDTTVLIEEEPTCSDSVLATAVLDKLGKPQNFDHIDMKKLWGGRFRANVWCRNGRFGQELTDTFFIVSSPTGIASSNPTIERKY